MFRTILFASVSTLLLAGACSAADAVTAAPEAPPAAASSSSFSWSGFYLGAIGGYDWQRPELSAGGDSFRFRMNDGRLGGFVGYNFDVGSGVIAGIEGDLGYDWGRFTQDGTTAKTGFNGSARARLGYGIDRALIYAAGGYAGTRFKINGEDENWSKTLNGWTIGAGVDYAVTDNIFARVEYRYNDFGKQSVADTGVDLKVKQNIVQVGLGVKF